MGLKKENNLPLHSQWADSGCARGALSHLTLKLKRFRSFSAKCVRSFSGLFRNHSGKTPETDRKKSGNIFRKKSGIFKVLRSVFVDSCRKLQFQNAPPNKKEKRPTRNQCLYPPPVDH